MLSFASSFVFFRWVNMFVQTLVINNIGLCYQPSRTLMLYVLLAVALVALKTSCAVCGFHGTRHSGNLGYKATLENPLLGIIGVPQGHRHLFWRAASSLSVLTLLHPSVSVIMSGAPFTSIHVLPSALTFWQTATDEHIPCTLRCCLGTFDKSSLPCLSPTCHCWMWSCHCSLLPLILTPLPIILPHQCTSFWDGTLVWVALCLWESSSHYLLVFFFFIILRSFKEEIVFFLTSISFISRDWWTLYRLICCTWTCLAINPESITVTIRGCLKER